MFYLKGLYNEIRLWLILNKIAKKNSKLLNEKNFRVDWIGRIYTVINLPEEVANHSSEIQNAYIIQTLREFDSFFLNIGVSDLVYPELRKLENGSSYLLILAPDREFLRPLPMIKFLFKFISILLIFRILWVIIKSNWNYVNDFFSQLINLIF